MIAPKRVLPKTSLPKAALAAQRKAPDYKNLPKGPKKPLMTRGRAIGLIVLLMITCLGAAWFTGLIGPDSRLAEIRDLQAKLGDQSLSDKDRRAVFEEMRTKMDALPEDARRKLWEDRRGQGPRMGVSPSKLLAMPEDKRNAELDKMLDRMVDFQKQAAKNGQGGPGGPGGRGPGGPGGGGPGGGQQNQWRNRMLSSMPAENRATWSIMRQLMQARAEQRGISMGGPPR